MLRVTGRTESFLGYCVVGMDLDLEIDQAAHTEQTPTILESVWSL